MNFFVKLFLIIFISFFCYGCAGKQYSKEQEQWAAAATAIIEQCPYKSNCGEYKNELNDMWGIYNREDMLAVLNWIETGGHSSYYDKIASQLLCSEGNFCGKDLYNEIIKLTWNNPEETINKLEVVKQFYKTTSGKSLTGWDYCRYIYLCRLGHKLGYLDEHEAWNRIITASKILQQTFGSWEDLANNYLIGHKFWSYQETVKKNIVFPDSLNSLIENPQSPWKKISWKTDLKK